MSLIDAFIERARQSPRRIVFPEGTSARILQAAAALRDRCIANPVLLGRPDAVTAAAAEAGVSLDGIDLIDVLDERRLGVYTTAYLDRHGNERGVSEAIGRRLVRKPLMFGSMMVALGEADAMVAGAEAQTALVILYATAGIGLAEGVSASSSFFLMVLPQFGDERDVPRIFADCAVNVDPDAETLAAIAVASARTGAALLPGDPRVALLSFSTRGSADHALVEKVREATALAQAALPDVLIDGELQLDTAVVPRVAARKAPDSPLEGRANVLVFPGLEAGNICYKSVQYMAGAVAYGPILQGFRRPVSDLSRGATADDIVGTTAILSVMAGPDA